jgi:aminoglycoside phosphotransferase (APT) family kinase protein
LELAVLRAAHAAGVPVAEPYWFIEPDGDGQGAGLVMARVEGEAIARRILRDDGFTRARENLVEQVAQAAAALHAIDPDAVPEVAGRTTGLHEQTQSTTGPLALITALEQRLDALGEPHPALELGLRRLRLTAPAAQEPRLVHGDLRLGNVMVGDAGLVAVLDWELVHLGDPAEDLGWMCSRAWRFGADEQPALGCGSREQLLGAYAAAGGRAISAEELRWWETFANVRWGVICVQQADVHLSGRRRSLEHAMIGRRTAEAEYDTLTML